MQNIHAIILAAGNSSRFGAVKQLHRVNGKGLLQQVVEQAQDLLGERVLVILGAEAGSIKPALMNYPATIIDNPAWQTGMASSIRTGVRALPSTCEAVLILLCDQPLLNRRILKMLLETWRDNPDMIIASSYRQTLGVPAIFPAAHFNSLLALEGDRGARQFLLQQRDRVLSVPVPEAGIDIDTPADLEQLDEQISILNGEMT